MIFVNLPGRLKGEESMVRHLPAVRSDHNPLLLSLTPENQRHRIRKPFRFEAAWLLHPDFLTFVNATWHDEEEVCVALQNLMLELLSWNQRVFGKIHKRKAQLLALIEGIQRALDHKPHPGLIELDQKLAREKWIALGDRNTRYFHAYTNIKRSNKISTLQINETNWVAESPQLMKFGMLSNKWARIRLLVSMVSNPFSSRARQPAGLSDTAIALIGKVHASETISQFRPISLCNVLYKFITKILAMLLQPLMGYFIGPTSLCYRQRCPPVGSCSLNAQQKGGTRVDDVET
ncbi:hypothetical protein V2J09_009528 [Rumex salicifolius]